MGRISIVNQNIGEPERNGERTPGGRITIHHGNGQAGGNQAGGNQAGGSQAAGNQTAGNQPSADEIHRLREEFRLEKENLNRRFEEEKRQLQNQNHGLQEENQRLQQANRRIQEENQTPQEEKQTLQQEVETLRSRSGSGQTGEEDRTNDETYMDDEIRMDDLEDKDSIIEEQRLRIAELERQAEAMSAQASPEELQRLRSELEEARQGHQAAQTALASFMAREKVVGIPDMITYSSVSEEQREIMRQYRTFYDKLRQQEGSSAVTFDCLVSLRDELEEKVQEMEQLQAQIAEAEEEKGTAFSRLQELNLRYQQDLKYVAFCEQASEQKIDGMDLFRRKLDELKAELDKLLEDGLNKAYAFKGTSLTAQLEEHKTGLFQTLEQLQELVESFEVTQEVDSGDTRTTESYKREAEEALAAFEETLRKVYAVSEKFMRIKNTIDFSFDN